jgi:microcystin-dependent protein
MPFEPIDREECIGDSLTKINLNAQNFDNRITALENNVSDLQDDVTVVNTRIDGIFSRGMIMMWSGNISNIPNGWVLCNGQNGAPDLRNRFVVGAGSSYQTGNTGGADTVRLSLEQVPAHNHGGLTGTDSPDHTHTGTTGGDYPDHSHYLTPDARYVDLNNANGPGNNRLGGYSGGQNIYTGHYTSGASTRHVHNITTGGASARHQHGIPVAGQDQFHENRPPYYALAYIMKT